MYRTLIVDDDMIVRMYLKDVIHWEDHGFTIVGIARDGEEALEIVKETDPDLILTDISMPRMNGIQLIQRLRRDQYDGVINVLSCHDDFEFVKSALQEGADDYLLKNYLNDTTMEDRLKKLAEQIQARHREADQRHNINTLARSGIDVIRRELLERILRGDMAPAACEQYMAQAKLHGTYHRLTAVLLQPSGADREQMHELLLLCEQRLENEAADVLLLRENTMALLVDLGDVASMAQSIDKVNRMELMIDRIAKQYLNLELAIAASAVCEGNEAIAQALRQANETLQHSFYGSGCWRYGQEEKLSSVLPEKARLFIKELPRLKENRQDEQLRELYAKTLEAMKANRVCAGEVLSWLRQCDHIAEMHRTENQYSQMKQFSDYLGCAEEYITHWSANPVREIPAHLSAQMCMAVKYLQQHFYEPIGLNDAAEQAGLSPAYFSTVFKQEMGIGFSAYLLSLRLERVCARLRATAQTSKQISEDAGFSDYPYFCRVFKKNLGVGPIEYRKSK